MSVNLRLTCLLCCAAGLLLGAESASASTITFENGGATLQVRADTDPVNSMKIGLVPGNPDDYRIADTASDIGAIPSSCLRETARSVRCPSDKVGAVSVFLSNGSDTFTVLDPANIPGNVTLTVRGGLGDDNIAGRFGAGKEFLYGNDGNDVVTAHCPGDGKTVNGGPGNDLLSICGTTQPRSLALYGLPHLGASGAIGTLIGEGGNDRLTGGPESDYIKAGAGNDIAKGGPGKDIIDCGAGKRDLGVGGGGRDLGKNCEKVKH